MTLPATLLDLIVSAKSHLERRRLERRWRRLRALGMGIGRNVWLPASTWIDTSHCFLISIGDDCGFGEECLILAHDAQMDEFLDAARVGRVIVHHSCHIGARCIILPGVEVGPRTIIGAGSVVTKSLPPDTVCTGNPARVICSLEEYLAKHRERLASAPTFVYERVTSSSGRTRMAEALAHRDGYITGGHSAELRGEGGTPRTDDGEGRRVPARE
ncbi:MAG TPA: acyltransferase [Gemmatimonadaceae bacterium]|nr:acyltransferase [Gemmatimonadaceae bacterium]